MRVREHGPRQVIGRWWLWAFGVLLAGSLIITNLAVRHELQAEADRICRNRNRQMEAVQTLLRGLARAQAEDPGTPPAIARARLDLYNEAYLSLAPVEC